LGLTFIDYNIFQQDLDLADKSQIFNLKIIILSYGQLSIWYRYEKLHILGKIYYLASKI